jgi:mannosylglycoprotein endo-beta-mannosidase
MTMNYASYKLVLVQLTVAFLFLLSLILVVAGEVEVEVGQEPDELTCDTIPIKWYACKHISDSGFFTGEEMSLRIHPHCKPTSVPSTVLSMLLRDGTFNNIDHENVYFGDNLKSIPDIEAVGSDYYTYWFVGQWDNDVKAIKCEHAQDFTHIVFRGINYRPEFYVNGFRVHDVEAFGETGMLSPTYNATGIFRRYDLDLSKVLQLSAKRATTLIAVLVHPPDFVGSAANGGQGGDHEIARNGAISQFAAGWDWIQATPDRNTGIWDKVSIVKSGALTLLDPVMRTLTISTDQGTGQTTAELLFETEVTNENFMSEGTLSGSLELSIIDADGNSVLQRSHSLDSVAPRSKMNITIGSITIVNVSLWWPHTHGRPYLYDVVVKVFTEKESTVPSFLSTFRHGVRLVEAYLDPITQGRAFRINGVPVYINGGNWIASDQFLRYSSGDEASVNRYWTEVSLHKEMGMNLIRVWGGGLAERPEFYDACDELGMLVHQEFWMTGDNNGRWGGNDSFPDDSSSYLLNAKHSILQLRTHPSLLLWCAGNELDPEGENPNPDIAPYLAGLVQLLDSARYYVPSSMSPQSPDPAMFNPEYALAPQDGPYGILYPNTMYNTRNPGLLGYEDVPISYQPEVGSVSTPVFRSLQRFLPPSSLASEAMPNYLSSRVDDMWNYHKYIPYTTENAYDHIYAYDPSIKPSVAEMGGTLLTSKETGSGGEGVVLTVQEYCDRAQLVQFQQYRALFEGYLLYQWKYYAAMIMWKSQSPWPALRGALYDYFLDYTGGFYGVKAALRMTQGIIFC